MCRLFGTGTFAGEERIVFPGMKQFEGKTFTEIGKEKFISGRQAQRREYAAIREFQRVLDSNQAQEAC